MAAKRTPALEWISAAIGLVLSLAVLAHLGWQVIERKQAPPPDIVIEAGAVAQTGAGYVVEVVARNRSPSPAANVTVRGELAAGSAPIETGEVMLDYVPGKSQAEGGLFFTRDPRAGMLRVFAAGYSEP